MKKLVPGILFVFLFSFFTPVHMADPAPAPEEEVEISSRDFIASLEDWVKSEVRKVGYYDTGITIQAPPLLRDVLGAKSLGGGLGTLVGGWGIRIEWGRPSILDGKYPRIDVNIINERSEAAGRLAEIALGYMRRQKADEELGAVVDAAEEGVEYEEPSLIRRFISDFSSKDHPWLQYSFSMLRLGKHALDQGMLKEILKKAGIRKKGADATVGRKQYLTLLWEFMRHNVLLALSLREFDTDHEFILDSLPEWALEQLRDASEYYYKGVKDKEKRYRFENAINDLWFNTWRYYKASFDDAGNVRNIGPAVYALRVDSRADGQQLIKEVHEFLSRIGDRTFDHFMRVILRARLKKAEGKRKGLIERTLKDLTLGERYTSFGLVDEQSKVEEKSREKKLYEKYIVPKAIVDAVKKVSAEEEGLPQLKIVSSGTRHWVILVTNKLDFLETNKLVFGIVARAVIESVKQWEKSLSPGTELGNEYAAVQSRLASLTRTQKMAKQFLYTSNPKLKELAKASKINVEDKIEELFKVTKESLEVFKPKARWPKTRVIELTTSEQLAAKRGELEALRPEKEVANRLAQALADLADQVNDFTPSEKVVGAVVGVTSVQRFLADEEALETLKGLVQERRVLADDIGISDMSSDEKVQVAAKIEQLRRQHDVELGALDERERVITDEITGLELAVKEETDEKPESERWIFEGNEAAHAIQLMLQEFDEHKKELVRINARIKIRRQVKQTEKLAKDEADKLQLLTLMGRKADWIKDNLSVLLDTKEDILSAEQNRLEAEKEKYSEDEGELIQARIDVLALQEASRTNDKGELKTAAVGVRSYSEEVILNLITVIKRIVDYQEIRKSDERFWVRAVEGFGDFVKRVQAKIPKFGEIQEKMITRLEVVGRNSIPFRQYTPEYMLGIQLLGGPLFDITKEQRKRLQRAGR